MKNTARLVWFMIALALLPSVCFAHPLLCNNVVRKSNFLTSLTTQPMALTKVKTKGQVTIPSALLREIGLRTGDFLSAKLERGGKITLTPQTIIDMEIAESLSNFKKGQAYGPFSSPKELVKSLQENVKKQVKQPRR